MHFKFENLLVWQLAMNLAEDLNIMLKNYPDYEKYNLVD